LLMMSVIYRLPIWRFTSRTDDWLRAWWSPILRADRRVTMTIAFSKAETFVRSRPKRIWSYCRRHWPTITLVSLVTLFVLIALSPYYCVRVPAGHVAVEWYSFAGGTDTETVYGEGGHFFFPWNNMSVYNTRVQQVSRDFDVLTQDGLMM